MILVTGGAGYIGCVLVEELLAKGESVRVFDKLFFGDEGLAAVRDRIDLVQGDVRAIDESAFAGVDAVIHLAGLSNDPTAEYNPRANYEMNTIATERIAKMGKKLGVRRFTFASSCSLYDKGLFAEDVLLDETAECAPRAAYAVSNYDAENILLDLADDNFCPVILRQGTVLRLQPANAIRSGRQHLSQGRSFQGLPDSLWRGRDVAAPGRRPGRCEGPHLRGRSI